MADDTPTTQDLVAAAARLLYGERWQSDLARDLGVSLRTLQSWYAAPASSSRRTIPPSVLSEVEALLTQRRALIDAWLMRGR